MNKTINKLTLPDALNEQFNLIQGLIVGINPQETIWICTCCNQIHKPIDVCVLAPRGLYNLYRKEKREIWENFSKAYSTSNNNELWCLSCAPKNKKIKVKSIVLSFLFVFFQKNID